MTCNTCKGFGYLLTAPSTCSAGGERVTCPVCAPKVASDTMREAGLDERNLEAQRLAIEACARIADRYAEPSETLSEFNSAYELAAQKIARAIRRLAPNAALSVQSPAAGQDGDLLEQAARVAESWYPDEEAAGCPATWADATHAIASAIRALNPTKDAQS